MSEKEKTNLERQPKRRFLNVAKWIFIISAGIILLIFFGVPLYLSSSGGTNFLLGKINQSVDGQVQMDDFSVGWFKGVELTKLSYADSAGNTSVTIDRLKTQPRYMSLLGGKVKLGRTVIDSPQVYLKVPQEKEQPVAVSSSKTKTEPSSASTPVFPINQIDLELINGTATVELTGDVPQKVAFTNIASKVQIADAGKPSSVDISMDVDDQSTLSAKGTATPAKKGWMLEDGDFNVQISKLQLASLKPLFALAGQPMDMAGELNADATIQISQNQVRQLQADAVISDFAQGTGDQRMVFEKPIIISAQTGQQGDTLIIDKFKIDSQFCNVACAGTLEAVDYTIDADLAQTQRLIGQFTDMDGLSMQGNLTASGNVSMTDQAVKAAGKGSIEKFVVKKGDVSTPATDAQMDFNCTVDQEKNQLRLASANLTATPGSVKIANLVLPMGDQADKTVSLNAQAKLDLAKTWAYAQVFSETLKDKNVSGQMDAALAISTTGSQIRLLAKDATCNNLKIEVPNTEPFVQDQVRLNGDILLDTDKKTIDIQDFDLQGEQGQTLIKITKGAVEKKVSGGTTHINGDFEAQYDWQTLSVFASVYLPTGLFVQGTRNDAFHFDSKFPTEQPEQMKANLNAAGVIGFEKARYQGLNFGPTEVKLNVKQGQALIDIPEADVNGGKVRFAGTVNIAETPMILHLRQETQVIENVNIDDVVSAQLLQYLHPAFVRANGVSGKASLSCSALDIPLGGETLKKDIHVIGSIGLTDVRLNSPLLGLFKEALRTEGLGLFSIPTSPFTVKDGFVEYEDMPMMFSKDFTLHFGGRIGLVDNSLAMNAGVPIDGRNVTVPFKGTRTNFKIDFAKLIELQGRQLIEQEIQRGLEKIFN